MHPVILGIALGTQLVVQISDHVPKLNVERTCKARIAGDKMMGLQQHQTYAECMSEENAAQQQLRPAWSSYSAAFQKRCAGEINALETHSYVDLLFCLQLAKEQESNKNSNGSITRKSPN
jgi:hypothetical protein